MIDVKILVSTEVSKNSERSELSSTHNLPTAKNNEQRITMVDWVTARNILVPFSSVTFTVKLVRLNSLDIQLSEGIQQLKDHKELIYKLDENIQLT